MKTIWRTKITYIDADTGEILNKELVKQQYSIINKIKTIDHGKKEYNGTIEWQYICLRKKFIQQRINFGT